MGRKARSGRRRPLACGHPVLRVAAAPPAASPQQPYSRSAELSDRLTQIARTKGLLFGPAIDVYVSNNVALIQGAVGTPSDSTQLATALAHKPGVLRIDNRLVAFGSIQATAQDPQRRPRSSGRRAAGDRQHGTHHEAGPNTGKTADAATKFSGGPISIINPATNTATLTYSLGGDAFTIPPGYRQNFHEDRAWAIRFSPAPTGMRSNTGFIRAFTRLTVRTTVGNCTTASCHELDHPGMFCHIEKTAEASTGHWQPRNRRQVDNRLVVEGSGRPSSN